VSGHRDRFAGAIWAAERILTECAVSLRTGSHRGGLPPAAGSELVALAERDAGRELVEILQALKRVRRSVEGL